MFCPPIEPPANSTMYSMINNYGYMDPTLQTYFQLEEDEYFYGAELHFTCDDGFTFPDHPIYTSVPIYCNETGGWNPELPTCEGIYHHLS